ncbi:MAG: choice-of-anchor D domain-containing protein [Myxococcota bacterium]|nr:choice-of-anchor D domain-containing protein [Myxococcota bacterium]
MNARPVLPLQLLLIAVSTAPLPACIEDGDGDPLDVFDLNESAIRWLPSSLDYGSLPGGASATDTLTITNIGLSNLVLSAADLDGESSADFAPLGDPAPITLPPGQVIQLEVAYTPSDEGEDSGWLLIESDDPINPLVEVPLSGRRTATPEAVVDPIQILFSDADEGEALSETAAICNDGDGELTLGQLTPTGSDAFALSDDPSGAILEPGDCAEIGVTYTPEDSSPDLGEIEIPSNDPQEPIAHLLLFGRCS